MAPRGSATPMKMGGGDGDQAAAKPGFSSEGSPYQKPKTRRIRSTIFLKMGDYPPHSQNWETRPPPSPPPPPPVAEPLMAPWPFLYSCIHEKSPTGGSPIKGEVPWIKTTTAEDTIIHEQV